MSNLRQQLQDSLDAIVAVDNAIHALYMAIADVDRLRMKNETADLVLRENEQISGASQFLQDIAEDIAQSIFKAAAE